MLTDECRWPSQCQNCRSLGGPSHVRSDQQCYRQRWMKQEMCDDEIWSVNIGDVFVSEPWFAYVWISESSIAMQHRHQRADLMRSGPSGPSGPSARPSQDLCRRSRAMASAASARSARSALALATLALVSGHVFSGTAASAQISGDIRSIFPCFPNAEMLLLHLKFQGIQGLASILYGWDWLSRYW